MASNEYSKKMCNELLILEDYLMSCRSANFQKDKIIVDKYKVLDIISSLRSYHCTDRADAQEEVKKAEPKVVAKIANDEPVRSDLADKEPASIEDAAENKESTPVQNSEEILYNDQDLVRYMEKKRAEAMKALEEEMAVRKAEEEQKLMNRVKNAQMIADQSLEKTKASHEENAVLIISEAEIKAKQIVSEAKINAEYMISQAETTAHVKQEEMEILLNEKIAAAEKQAEEIIAKATAQAEQILEQNERDAANVTLAGFKRAESYIEQAEGIYLQQLGVIKTDREALNNILKVLDEIE